MANITAVIMYTFLTKAYPDFYSRITTEEFDRETSMKNCAAGIHMLT